MDGVPQTTFVPRKPMSDAAQIKRGGGGGIFLTIAFLIFAVVLLVAAGLFFYGNFYLPNQVVTEQSTLHSVVQQFNSSPLSDMTTLSNQLTAAQTIIGQHTALSKFFDYLSASTVAEVGFTDFSYTTDNNTLSINLKGEAASFAALQAEEAQLLAPGSILENPTVSDIAVTKIGTISFTIIGTIAAANISYQQTTANNLTASSTP